jgi:hypothetical protein
MRQTIARFIIVQRKENNALPYASNIFVIYMPFHAISIRYNIGVDQMTKKFALSELKSKCVS